MRYAVIVDGEVVNLIVADDEFVKNHLPETQIAAPLDEKDPTGIQWEHDGEKFVEPEPRRYEDLSADMATILDGKIPE